MSLLQRKLKIWSSAPSGGVYVWQDGSAVDPHATHQVNDAFNDPPEGEIGAWPIELRGAWTDFPTFQFKIEGWVYNGPGYGSRVQPNDRVEFWAEVPESKDASAAWPDWHVLSQTEGTQVRLFYGWVQTVSPTDADGYTTVECSGAAKKANEVMLVRDQANGVRIPSIAFNVDDLNSPEFTYSVKADNADRIKGPGLPAFADPTTWMMTIRDMLVYLEEAYGAELASLGVTASTEIWDADDLTTLDQVPPEIILQNAGFFAGVRQILERAPHVRLFHDPRTLKFRVIPIMSALTSTEVTLTATMSAVGDDTTIPVSDTSFFSATPGQPGNQVILRRTAYPDEWDQATVLSVGPSSIVIQGSPQYTYVLADTVSVVASQALPTLLTSIEELAGGSFAPGVDLDDTHTAVRITAHQQRTTTHKQVWKPGDAMLLARKGWDPVYEAGWKREHEKRQVDNGFGGDGISIYAMDSGGTDSQIRLFFAFEESAFEEDHEDGEWDRTSCWILSAKGASIREADTTFTVASSTTTADIGDGRPGMIIELATTDLLGAVGGSFRTEAVDGSGDLISLTSANRFATTGDQNGRAKVGRAWYLTEETVSNEGPSRHDSNCYPTQVVVNDCTGDLRHQSVGTPGGGAPGNQTNQGPQWELHAGGTGLGQISVWRRSFNTPRAVACPDKGGCGGTGWVPPQSMEITIERTDTTIREARYPAAGFAGQAKALMGLEREETMLSDAWTSDIQTPFYEALAERLWQVRSQPRWSGGFDLNGIQRWGGLIDLGVRLAFTHTFGPQGGSSDFVRGMWALPIDVSLDFVGDVVRVNLDNHEVWGSLARAVHEDFGQKTKVLLRLADQNAKIAAAKAECALNQNANPAVSGVCGQDVFTGRRPVGPGIKVTNKDNEGHGLTPMDSVGSGGGRGGGALGFKADRTVFRDAQGSLYEVGPAGDIVAGAIVSGRFVPDYSASPHPRTVGAGHEEVLRGLLALNGLTPVLDARPVFGEILSTGTGATTVFTLKHAHWDVDELVGGRIIPNTWDDRNPRGEGYEILSNTASKITVAAISEDDPPDGSSVVIWPKPAPRPDETDFPNGGTVVKDTNGDFGVLDHSTGEIAAGTLNAGTNRIEEGGNLELSDGAASRSGSTVTRKGALPSGRSTVEAESGITTLDVLADLVLVDTTSGSATLDLPLASAVSKGHTITVKDAGGNANVDAITISRSGSDTIDGETAVILTLSHEAVELASDGVSTWHEVSRLAGTGASLKDVVMASSGIWNPETTNPYLHWSAASRLWDSDVQMHVGDAADGSTESFGIQVHKVPAWFAALDGSDDVVIDVTFYLLTAPTASDAVLFRTRRAAWVSGADLSAVSWSNTDEAVTVDGLSAYEEHTVRLGTGSGWVLDGGRAKFTVQRRGSEGSDTYTGTVRIVSIEIVSGRTG